MQSFGNCGVQSGCSEGSHRLCCRIAKGFQTWEHQWCWWREPVLFHFYIFLFTSSNRRLLNTHLLPALTVYLQVGATAPRDERTLPRIFLEGDGPCSCHKHYGMKSSLLNDYLDEKRVSFTSWELSFPRWCLSLRKFIEGIVSWRLSQKLLIWSVSPSSLVSPGQLPSHSLI